MSQAHDSINAVGEIVTERAKGFRAFGLIMAELGFCMVMPWLRNRLGERFFSPFMIAVMTIFTFSVANMMNASPTYISAYVGLLVALSIYHLFVINRRNAKDEQWHTRYEGNFNIQPLVSKLPKGKSYWWCEGFYEPLLVLIIGLLINKFLDAGLGALFVFSAAWMVIRARFYYFLYREKLLDERDALIESEVKLDAVNGKPASETKGFIVKGVNTMKPNDKKAVARSMLSEKDFSEISS